MRALSTVGSFRWFFWWAQAYEQDPGSPKDHPATSVYTSSSCSVALAHKLLTDHCFQRTLCYDCLGLYALNCVHIHSDGAVLLDYKEGVLFCGLWIFSPSFQGEIASNRRPLSFMSSNELKLYCPDVIPALQSRIDIAIISDPKIAFTTEPRQVGMVHGSSVTI